MVLERHGPHCDVSVLGAAATGLAEQVLAAGGLPDDPEEMRETFKKLMEEHTIDTRKYLS